MSLTLVDEVGNPLPPGIFVTVTDLAGNLVGSGYVFNGGTANITVQGAVPYVATFKGTQAPLQPFSFTGNAQAGQPTVLQVSPYRSPTMSLAGYTQEVLSLYPRGWLPTIAQQPGGVAYALFASLAKGVAILDGETESLIGAERAQTCVGADLDSWAADFFGSWLLRYPEEPDALYLGRIFAAFGPRCTLAAIEQLVNQFYAATVAATIMAQQQNLGYETAGGYDTRGGYDIYVPPQSSAELIPTVSVWDAQSNPSLAGAFGILPPRFVIQIGFSDAAIGWYLDFTALDFDAALIDGNDQQISTTAPDPRLGALVNLVKAAGTQPLYATYIT